MTGRPGHRTRNPAKRPPTRPAAATLKGMRIDRAWLTGSMAGAATATGVVGLLLARRQRRIEQRITRTADTMRDLELRLNEVDEELGVRLNEVDEEVESLRRGRTAPGGTAAGPAGAGR